MVNKGKEVFRNFMVKINPYLKGETIEEVQETFSVFDMAGKLSELATALFVIIKSSNFKLLLSAFAKVTLIVNSLWFIAILVEVAQAASNRYDNKPYEFDEADYAKEILFVVVLGVLQFLPTILSGIYGDYALLMLILHLLPVVLYTMIEYALIKAIIMLSLKITYSKVSVRLVMRFSQWLFTTDDDSDSDDRFDGGLGGGFIPILVSVVQSHTSKKETPFIEGLMARFTPGLFFMPSFHILS